MKDAIQRITGKPVGFDNTDGWVYLGSFDPVDLEIVAQAELLKVEREDTAVAAEVREERDRLIQLTSWRVQRHYDELALGLPPSEPLEPLQVYTQALRDVPGQQGFPHDVVWPVLE